MSSSSKWLEHIETSIPKEAFGYPVSMYSIALEGWRRGLSLKFKNNYRVKAVVPYVLSGYGKEIEFIGTRSEYVTKEAISICTNKEKTKKYLIESNVSTPKGKVFEKENDEEIIRYANRLGYPLVIKPTNASGGKGVIANIKSESEFKEALIYVRSNLGFSRIIVEEFIKGKDYRLYVIGNNVVAAFNRIPANVTGDGEHTIRELFRMKRKERAKNPGIFNQNIKLDKETKNLLLEQGYTLNSIPKKGDIVFLEGNSNVLSAGEIVDATDKLPSYVKKEAVKAFRAIPGLIQAGIDILYDEESDNFSVIEINTQPSIGGHLFPMKGIARDVPKAIIDYYFPETTSLDTSKGPLYYFDYQSLFENFQTGNAEEIIIPSIPKGELTSVRFKVTGAIRGVNFGRWTRRQTSVLELHGFIKFTGSKNAEIVVSGSKDSVDRFESLIKDNSNRGAKIKQINKEDYNKPIKIGFEIIRTKEKKKLKKESKKRTKRSKKHFDSYNLRKERDFYKKQYEKMRNSTSWKVTKPLRVIGRLKNYLRNK